MIKARSRVTSHLVERADAAGRGVSEEAAVQHHGPSQQVESEEHGQSQHDLQLRLGQRQATRGLLEVRQQAHRIGMDGHHRQLQGYQCQAVRRHGNPPILCADVVDVELHQRDGGQSVTVKPLHRKELVLHKSVWSEDD